MKKKLFAIILFSNFVHAQVGINTDTPNSTLTVNGSYAGNFRFVNSDITLGDTDQFINVVSNTAITITLPNIIAQPSVRGRVYTIKNTSTQNLNIRGFSNNERLRTSNGTLFTNVVVPPGTTVQVVKNQVSTNTNFAFWEVILQSNITITDTEPSRTLTFARSISSPINANTPDNSIVRIGNLIVRYNGTTPDNPGFIEYALRTSSHVTVWYKKAGSGGTGYDSWSTRVAPTGFWYRMNTQGNEDNYNIHAGNRDVSEAIIILHNTREVYRITSNLNGAIGASGGVPAVASSATLFVEKLD